MMRVSHGYSLTKNGIVDAGFFAQACWSYREHTPGRKFPAELSDLLLRSPQGIGPFKDMRDDKCDDPWGNPYKYALVPNENGDLEPYVWAESIVDGKLRLYGAKCGADGMVIRFGWPEGR